MVLLTAEEPVAIVVAGGHQRVVDARRGVLLEEQDRPAAVRLEVMALARKDRADGGPHVLHGHELVQVLGAEGPGIHHLRAVRVDDLDRLTLGEARRAALARGHCHEIAFLGHRGTSSDVLRA